MRQTDRRHDVMLVAEFMLRQLDCTCVCWLVVYKGEAWVESLSEAVE